MTTLTPRTFAITFDQKLKVIRMLQSYSAERTPEGKAVITMLNTLPEMLDILEAAKDPLPPLPLS